MATRRFRVKAVANVAVSRGRCGEKPRENEKLDEKTSSNSSITSDSHEATPRETKLAESDSDVSLVEKLPEDRSLNETLENALVSHLVQSSESVVGTLTCLEANDSASPTPVDTQSEGKCNLTQHSRYTEVQQSDNCDRKEASPCNGTDENFTVSAGEHSLKTEDIIDSMSGDSSVTDPQKADTTESKMPTAPVRLIRKRVKPTVSLSLVNRKAKENATEEVTQQCNSLNESVENASVNHLAQNSVNFNDLTSLEANERACSTHVDAPSITVGQLVQHPAHSDVQHSGSSDSKGISLYNKTGEDVSVSTAEHRFESKEGIDSLRSEDLRATTAEKIDTTETKIPPAPIRLPRKRVKPTVSLSSLNKKLKEAPSVDNPQFPQNSADVDEPTRLEENGSGHSTPVITPNVVNCNLTQHTEYFGVQESNNCDSKDVLLCNRTNEDTAATTGEHCSKTEESISSVESGNSCATSAERIDTTETKISAAPIRLPRKRIKPAISLSVVNKKVKENPTEQLTQHCSASKIDDNSTVQVPKKLQAFEASSDLDKNVGTSDSVKTIPAVSHETSSSSMLCEVQGKNDPEISSHVCEEVQACQSTVCVPERKNGIPPDVISVDAPVGEPCIGTASVSTPICESPSASTPIGESPVVNEFSAVGKDKGASPPVKCSANQSVKDCSPLNTFRSRFVRPKPLLELAARRNRTASVGSASESDSEKKSLSSATTVSPPWQPKLKTSKTMLTHAQAVKTEKLANASSASTDESEDERSSISKATTISPPKKIARLDSYCGSDTSHSEFSQDVSEESSSPVKKPYTKPERVTKRKEYLRRIIEIKKEISHKVSDGKVNKSRLTMFDLIYYNPVTNPMKSVQEPDVKKPEPAPTNATENETRLAEESVDEPELLEDKEDRSSTVPVPQVKVGPNGEIILDEQSLVIETTDAKKNWNDLQNSEVIMDYGTGSTTFNAYSKKKKSRTKDWSREETLRFYRALHTVGTDFLVMQSLFPKFTRKELKARYKKEERTNRELVEKALRNPLTFDLTDLQKEFEVERLEEEQRLAQPKEQKRRGGCRRSCSLFAALDSTDKGKVRSEGKNVGKCKIKNKPVRRIHHKFTDLEQTHSKKKRKADDSRTPSEYTPDSEETCNKKKRKAVNTRTPPACKPHRAETLNKKMRKADDKSAPSESTADCDVSNATDGHVYSESSVPGVITQVKPTRSGRIPRPRIFEDFMTDDVEEIYEETHITEICDRVTVEDICDLEPVGDGEPSEHEELDGEPSEHEELDGEPSEHEELVVSDNDLADEDTRATYESDNDDQNFVIAEDAMTVQQSQVNLGSVYSNVKPGTLIVLATESPDNPGHQIFRVFMVSNNSETLPVSVTNNQALPTGTNNSVQMDTVTDPVVSESSTNDCNSPQMNAERSS